MPKSLATFIEAATGSLARALASFQREADRDRELQQAEHRARTAELDLRIAAVAALEKQVADKLATLKDGEPGPAPDADEIAALVGAKVADAISALPKAASIQMEDVTAEVERIVASLPPPAELPDVPALVRQEVAGAAHAINLELRGELYGREQVEKLIEDLVASSTQPIERMIGEAVNKAVAELPLAKDGDPGKDADPALIERMVAEAVAALPPAENGKDVDPEQVATLVRAEVEKAVAAIPVPKDGEPGEPGKDGKLPVVRAWMDAIHREGDVVSHAGATWQASRDTGKEPPHADWTCLAAAGRPGRDADAIEVRGTYDADENYGRLNIVALNGGAFISRVANPGACPGEDWQQIAMRGKPGQAIKGDRGEPGAPGKFAGVMSFGEDGILRLRNADGTEASCDLYPILSRLGRG